MTRLPTPVLDNVHPMNFLSAFNFCESVSTCKKTVHSGLSLNILHAGDKSPVQRGFFKNSTGDLLSAVRFLSRLCNFCNYIFFNHNGM